PQSIDELRTALGWPETQSAATASTAPHALSNDNSQRIAGPQRANSSGARAGPVSRRTATRGRLWLGVAALGATACIIGAFVLQEGGQWGELATRLGAPFGIYPSKRMQDAFDRAKTAGTLTAWDGFVAEFKSGPLVEQAKQERAALAMTI